MADNRLDFGILKNCQKYFPEQDFSYTADFENANKFPIAHFQKLYNEN